MLGGARYSGRVRSPLVLRCVALLWLSACGGGEVPADAAVDAGPCVPITCEDADAECGAIDDGCGGSLACGDCALGEACGFVRPLRCGGECASDADCDRGEVCDLGAARCTTGCRTGSSLAVDLPHHPVTFEVTLDGAPLPEAAGGAVPTLQIVPQATAGDARSGYWLHPYELDDGSWRLRDRLEGNLPPGDYEVWYSLEGGDPAAPFPWAGHTHLTALRVEPGDATVVVDIPVAHVTLRTRLSSAALPEVTDGWSSSPRLQVARSTFVPLYDEVTGEPRAAITVPLVAGAPFSVRYDGSDDAAFAAFPRNGLSPLHESIAVDGDVVDLDIGAVRLAVELRFDGSPAGPGTHRLVLSRDGEPDVVVEFTDPASTDLTLRPGIYGLEYRGSAAGGGTRGVELVAATDGRRVLDFATTRATFRVTTSAGPRPGCPGSAHIFLGATRIDLGPSDEETRVTARVLEGEYVPSFRPGEPCAEGESGWPADVAALPAVQVRGESPEVSLFVPRHALTLAVTLDGERPPDLPADGGSAPSLWVGPTERGPGAAGAWVPLYRAAPEGGIVPVTTHTLWLHDREYDVHYDGVSGDYEAVWPVGARRVLGALHPATRPTVSIDVARAPSRLEVTSGGRPLPARVEEGWEHLAPVVRLTASEGEATQVVLFSTDGVPIAPRERWHAPGRYQLTFDGYTDRHRLGTRLYARSGLPPLGTPLGCWDAR